MASVNENITEIQKDVNEINSLPETLEKLRVDTHELSNFLLGMRLKPVPLDMPQSLTTTEWLMTLTENVNQILDGYNDFDEKTKVALEKYGKLLDEIITTMCDTMQQIQDNNEYLGSNIDTILYRTDTVSSQLDDLDRRLTAYVSTGATEDTELIGQIKDIVSQWSKVLADIKRTENGVSDALSEIENANRNIALLQENFASYKLNYNIIEERINKLVKEMADINNNQLPDGLNAQIGALEKSAQSLSTALDTSNSNITRLNSAIETLQSHQSALEANVGQWQNQINLNGKMISSLNEITSDLKLKTQQLDNISTMAYNQTNINSTLISQIGANQQRIIENARSFSGTLYVTSAGHDNLGECFLRKDGNGYKNAYTEAYGDSSIGGLGFPNLCTIMDICQFTFTMRNAGIAKFAVKQPFSSIDTTEKFARGNYFKLSSGYHTIKYNIFNDENVETYFSPENQNVLLLCRVKDERVCDREITNFTEVMPTEGRMRTSRKTTQAADIVSASVNLGSENVYDIVNRIYIPYENDLESYTYFFAMLRSSDTCKFRIKIDDFEY